MTHHCVYPGDTIHIEASPEFTPVHVTPPDIWNFLESRGWKENGGRTDADDPEVSAILQWTHEEKGRLGFSWEQAMAFEFYEFITLGGK